jgi:CBS domain containing-hemolysin-like protein
MLWVGIESERWQHAISFGIGYTLLTFLHIIVGEQGPKFLAIKRPLEASLQVAYPLKWFFYATYPFIWFLNIASLWFLRQFGIDTQGEHDHGSDHSSDELRLMVAARQRDPGEGALGQEIVLNAFDLRHRTVRDIMRPRHEIVALDTSASLTDCIEVADRTRYSRFPLAEDGNLDRTVGVVHFKDLFASRHTAKTGDDLRGVARKLIYVPESARLEKVLGLFLERKLHFAIVVDEYGGSTGVVTLENCLEQLVGEIQDEFEQEKPRLIARGENEWELEGTLPLFELAELIGQPIPAEGVTSVGGWLTQRLGGFPKRGDRVSSANHDFVVDELAGLRVAKVTVRRRPRGDSGDTTFFTTPNSKPH